MIENYQYKISILIVTYNNAATISDCLKSLQEQTLQDFEILVLDNCSNDRTLDELEKYNSINVYPSERNIGFAAGMNRLSKQSRGEYLFMLNPDCVCPNDTLEALSEFALNHEGVLSPALVYPDGTSQPSARQFISYKNILFSRRSPFYQLGLVKTDTAGYFMPADPAKAPAVSATALFILNELFLKIGGFDERFYLYLEDIDLCLRLSKIDVDIWYLPDIKLKHSLGASSKGSSARAAYYHHFSMYKYFTKHFPNNYIRNTLLLILLAGGFAVSVFLNVFKPKRRQ